jgi:hypothetical protein
MTKNYGRDDLMAVAAFRYSLGRMTYIVSDCAYRYSHYVCTAITG